MQTRRSTGRAPAVRAEQLTFRSISSLRGFVFSLLVACFGAASFAGSNVVEYTYDAAGNIVQIARQTAPGLTVTSFDPASGPVGAAVTIYGSGFDPTPANNTVKFNGTVATVTAAAGGSISTTVPSGATTGPISLTVGTSTASSVQAFTVTVPGAPTITGFTPTSGAATTSVTVSGTAFDVNPGATTVSLNGAAAAVSVASDTSLSFAVPASVSSGKITVTTTGGTATSASDFIVPPPGVNATDIVATARVTPAGPSANIAVPTLGKYGLVLFDAQPNVYYSVQFGAMAISPSTATVSYQVIKPDNSVLQTGAISGGLNRPSIHLPLLPVAGTYGVLLSAGAATVNVNARVEVNPVVTIDGAAVASTLDYAYQSARFVFDATANQHIGIGVVGLVFTPASINSPYNAFRVFRPDGTEMNSPMTCGGPTSLDPQGNCDGELVAPVTGRYTAIQETPSNAYGIFQLQLSSEVNGVLTPDAPQVVNLARVGQDARYAFTASAGDSLALDLSGASLLPQAQSVNLLVSKPDGTFFKSCSSTPPSLLYCELFGLPATGTYSVSIDPAYGAYGNFALDLKQGPLLQVTDPATAFATTSWSESARFRFSATAGQNLSIGLGALAYDTGTTSGLAVFAPSGASVGQAGSCNTTSGGGYCRWTATNLSQTGVYSVQVQPPIGAKMSGNITLSTDITGTLAPSTPQVISTNRQAQFARYTFTGTAGDSTSIKLLGVSTTPAGRPLALYVYQPGGTVLTSTSTSGGSSAFANYASLPATGTYTVVVDPQTGGAWQGSLGLDPGTAIAVDGSLASASSAYVGEPLRYRVPLTAGQRVEFGMTGFALSPASSSTTYATLYSPTGAAAWQVGCSAANGMCEGALASAPATGTYSLLLSPPPTNAIASGTFALSSPLSGTLVAGDPAQAIAINRPGQTARYTFSGTAGQLLHLGWSSAVVSGGAYVAVTVLNPSGTTVANSSFLNGATGGFNIPSLTATGTYTVVLDPSAAQTMSASISLVFR